MAYNHPHPQQQPHQPQEPDPAGSTQMFQAFVHGGEGAPPSGAPRTNSGSGKRIALTLAAVLVVAGLAAVAVLALG
ncbi:hypothetical protein ACTWP5_05855 [Streptomyces sp. 4N509B]|uniref:hypothetical protein n=1 Tax=Streptomyces sp. 4N509B TaxID=3457413 RepID=UPI003FCF9037